MQANRAKAAKLAAGFAAAVFVVPALLLFLVGAGVLVAIVLPLIVAGAWVGLAWKTGSSTVLYLCDAEPADPQRHARYFNVVQGLCMAAGVPMPELYVIEDAALNSLCTGSSLTQASIVVTQGLLDELNLVELEAITAVQLYRIKGGDILPETFVVSTLGIFGVLSAVTEQWPGVSKVLAWPMRFVDGHVITRLHSRRGELDVDLGAMDITQYPPGLAAALTKMSGRTATAAASPVTAHLWMAPPISPAVQPALTKVHASLSERIALLHEL